MRLDLEPHDYLRAATSIGKAKRALFSAADNLVSSLSACTEMAGTDGGGKEFATAYDHGAKQIISEFDSLYDALDGIEYGLRLSGRIHAIGEHQASERAGDPPGFPEPSKPSSNYSGQHNFFNPPSAHGGEISAPPGWDWIENVIHIPWLNGNTGKLKRASTAWNTCANKVDAVRCVLSGIPGGLNSDVTPDISMVQSHIRKVEQFCLTLKLHCSDMARSCNGFAQDLNNTRDEIRNMLLKLLGEVVVTEVVCAALSFFSAGSATVLGNAAMVKRIEGIASAIRGIIVMLRARAFTYVRPMLSITKSTTKIRKLSKFETFVVSSVSKTAVGTAVEVTSQGIQGESISLASLGNTIVNNGIGAVVGGSSKILIGKVAGKLGTGTSKLARGTSKFLSYDEVQGIASSMASSTIVETKEEVCEGDVSLSRIITNGPMRGAINGTASAFGKYTYDTRRYQGDTPREKTMADTLARDSAGAIASKSTSKLFDSGVGKYLFPDAKESQETPVSNSGSSPVKSTPTKTPQILTGLDDLLPTFKPTPIAGIPVETNSTQSPVCTAVPSTPTQKPKSILSPTPLP